MLMRSNIMTKINLAEKLLDSKNSPFLRKLIVHGPIEFIHRLARPNIDLCILVWRSYGPINGEMTFLGPVHPETKNA